MAGDQKIMIQFGADISALETALKQAAAMVQASAAEMEKKGTSRRGSAGNSASRRIAAAARRSQEIGTEMMQKSVAAAMTLDRLQLAGHKEMLAQEVVEGKITQAERLADLKGLLMQENALEQARLGQEEKNQNLSLAARQSAFEKSRILQAQYNNQVQKLNDQMVQASIKSWSKFFQPIDNAFSQTITGVIRGTETLRQAMARMAQSILLSWVDIEEKKLTKAIATQLGITTATQAGVAARTAAEQAGQGTSLLAMATTAIKSIANDAATTFGGVFAFLSPLMGPAAAGPATAAMAGVASMSGAIVSAAGGYDIPAGVNPIAQLHAQEMVLPASLANSIRNMTGAGAGGLGGGEVHIHGPLVQAIDAQSGAQFLLRNSGIIASALAREFRNANAALAALGA